MPILDHVANRQAVWSATAKELKARIDLARKTGFAFSIGGALAAALASTQADGTTRTVLTAIGAAALAITGILASRVLTADGVARHVRARAASEALKREAFLFAASGPPYDDPATREAKLTDAQTSIAEKVANLALYERPAAGKGDAPRVDLNFDDYMTQRVDDQINFYRGRATDFEKPARLLHLAEFMLAFVAAILTALAGAIGKGVFDLAAITAVLTTIAGAVLAHLQASRYDELITSYRAAASRLENLKATMPTDTPVAQLAAKAEDIISAETNSWQAMWLS